jgi:hypothetical protein
LDWPPSKIWAVDKPFARVKLQRETSVEFVLNKAKTLGSIADPVKASLPPPEYSSEKRLERASPTTKEGLPSQDDFDTLYAWEQGKLSMPETLSFFQDMVSTGQAWKSTGAVRRMAAQLIRGGLIHR